MFDESTLPAIVSSIRSGQYNLLLGAGVSLDSHNATGDALPGGDQFRLDLCTLKSANPRSTLQRVYSSLSDDEVSKYVVGRFRGCTPGPTLKALTQFLWRRIFTFNIDDALEAAYQERTAYQIAAGFHFEDQFVELQDQSTVPIIHLHGWVRTPLRGFVFSLAEYVRQIRSINPWMVVLTQYIPVEPFIIAGTALDEVDLEYYLAHRSEVTARKDRAPSILVEPHPDAVTKRDCERYDLMLFEGTFAEFLSYVDSKIPDRVHPIELVPETTRGLFPTGTPEKDVLSFAADFELAPHTVERAGRDSLFLYGYPPTWQDLGSGLDVSRTLTALVKAELTKSFNDPAEPRFILLLDQTGAGKSTVLKRVAFDIAQTGSIHVLTCTALSRIDVETTARALDLIKGPTLIVVDNFADQANAIVDTALRTAKRDVVFLCAERDYRHKYVKQALTALEYVVLPKMTLGDREADQLIKRYTEQGLTGTTDAQIGAKPFRDEVRREPIAVACCRIMNDFRPLDRIIESVIAAAAQTDRVRYTTAALAHHCFRGGVRYEVLAAIAGREGWDQQVGQVHPLPLAYFDRNRNDFVIPLNATIATRLLDRSNPDALLPVFVSLANAIASRVNRDAVRHRTPEARLAGRLFDYDQIVRGFLRGRSAEFYEQTQEAWQWTSRYWEQVALLELSEFFASHGSRGGLMALTRSLQHARHAVSIEEHPLSLTTLGKVLLAHMQTDEQDLDIYYNEAFDRLTAAIKSERQRDRVNVQPYASLFRGTRDYFALGGEVAESQAESLRTLIRDAAYLFRYDEDVREVVSEIAPLVNYID